MVIQRDKALRDWCEVTTAKLKLLGVFEQELLSTSFKIEFFKSPKSALGLQ
jgi:hypothetical protein